MCSAEHLTLFGSNKAMNSRRLRRHRRPLRSCWSSEEVPFAYTLARLQPCMRRMSETSKVQVDLPESS